MTDKPESTREVLSGLARVMDISDAKFNAIIEEVQANRGLLNECLRHDFRPVHGCAPLARVVKCSRCGGTLDALQARWYQEGLDHATRSSLMPEFEDIMARRDNSSSDSPED